MRPSQRAGALRSEIEQRIRTGSCVYCRAPAAPDRPLTREHVIPQSRGGRRRDSRIIVPACARCNQRRGCQEVVLFLLARPRRIAAFLEYLSTLSEGTVRQIDLRVLAELYAAVWLLGDSVDGGAFWRTRLRHLCAGRRLHRRRYAARRIFAAVEERIERTRNRSTRPEAPSCLLPAPTVNGAVESSLARTTAALVGTLALFWDVSAERVMAELAAARCRSEVRAARNGGDESGASTGGADPYALPGEADGVVSLDGWTQTSRKRRSATDPRRGGAGRRRGRYMKGRAA